MNPLGVPRFLCQGVSLKIRSSPHSSNPTELSGIFFEVNNREGQCPYAENRELFGRYTMRCVNLFVVVYYPGIFVSKHLIKLTKVAVPRLEKFFWRLSSFTQSSNKFIFISFNLAR
jgi:hypothetical protein